MKRSRTVYAAWVFVAVVFYVMSIGPVTWLVYRWCGGFDYGSRLPAILDTLYAPVHWVVDHSPDTVHRVWTQYVDYFYEAAYRADMEQWSDDGSRFLSMEFDWQPEVAPRYGSRTLEEWQTHLKDVDPNATSQSEDVAGLVALVESKEVPWFTRRQAALALGRIRAAVSQAVPVLIQLLESSEHRTKAEGEHSPAVWSAQAIAKIGPDARAAAPILINIAGDRARSFIERLAAIEALAAIGTAEPSVLEALIATFEADEPVTHQTPNPALLREASAEALTVVGPGAAPSVPALARALQDRVEGVRLKSVLALGAMGPRSEIALPALLESMAFDDSPSVRDAAVIAVGKVGEGAIPSLIPLLSQPDAELRTRALGAVGNIGRAAASAANQLIPLLEDKDSSVRITAAESLWKIDPSHERVPDALARALADQDRQHRMRAARALVRMGAAAQPAAEALRKLTAEDPRDDVRRLAAQTLRSIDPPAEPHDRKALPPH